LNGFYEIKYCNWETPEDEKECYLGCFKDDPNGKRGRDLPVKVSFDGYPLSPCGCRERCKETPVPKTKPVEYY
jgi:hypothetical protein